MGQKIHPLGFRVGITRDYRSQWFSQSNHYSQLLLDDNSIRQYIMKSFPQAEITEIQIKRHLRLEDNKNHNLLKTGLQNFESIIVRIRAQHPENIVGVELTDFEKLKNCQKVLKQKLEKNRQQFLKHFYSSTPPTTEKNKVKPKTQSITIYVSKVFSPCSEASSIAHFLVEKFEKRKKVRCDVRGILKEFSILLKKRRKKLINSRRILFKKRYQLAVNTFLKNLKQKKEKYQKLKEKFTQPENSSSSSAVSVFKQNQNSSFKCFKPLKRKGVKIQISGRLNGAEIARSLWSRKGRVPLQTLNASIDYSYQTALTIYGLIGIKVWVFREERKPLLQGEIFYSPVEENPLLLPPILHQKVQQIMTLKMQTE